MRQREGVRGAHPLWLEARLVCHRDEFWARAGGGDGVGAAGGGGAEAYPRQLVGAISLALPAAVILVPGLSTVEAWRRLRARGIPCPDLGPDRPLHGCLVAQGGHGFVLVDATDPDDERRFTLAHEAAHLILDYIEPRATALAALGEEIRSVLDGARSPTSVERLDASLRGVPLGLHVELMERAGDGGYTSHDTLAAEDRADRLALELLAPAEEVWAAISALAEARGSGNGSGYSTFRQATNEALRRDYGLPARQANAYAAWLLKEAGHTPSFTDWLGTP